MERYQLLFDDHGRLDRRAITGGMWLRVGTAAAFVFVGGLVALINGDTTVAQSLAMGLGGAAVCALAWRRAWTTLNGGNASVFRAGAATSPQGRPKAAEAL